LGSFDARLGQLARLKKGENGDPIDGVLCSMALRAVPTIGSYVMISTAQRAMLREGERFTASDALPSFVSKRATCQPEIIYFISHCPAAACCCAASPVKVTRASAWEAARYAAVMIAGSVP